MTAILKVSSILVLLMLSSITLADPALDFEAGKRAFGNGDYALAIEYFQQARDAGLEGPAVHYNIAVAQYELGRYPMARETFELISRRFPRMRALAEYNLGLVAERLDEEKKAADHFRRAWELSEDDRNLRYLAAKQLQQYSPEEQSRPQARWTGAFGLRAGHDGNVALRDELALPVGTTAESPMADLFGSIAGPRSGDDGLGFEGSAYVVRYADADEFDQAEVRAGALYEWRPLNWRLGAGVHASASTLGGDSFDRKVGVNARAVRYLGNRATVDVRLNYDDISDANTLFAGIAGSRIQLDLRYTHYIDDHRVQLRYWVENNDRRDAGVSPARNRIAFLYRYQPALGLGFEAGIDRRESDYDDLEDPREEELTTLRAALTWEIESNWLFLLELRSASNDSDDPLFDYDRDQATIGVMKYF